MPSKYIIIYRKGNKKDPGEGNLTDVRVGDAVSYMRDKGGETTVVVAKVNVRVGVLRTEPTKYNGSVLHPAKTLKFNEIIKLQRLNPLSEANPDVLPNVVDLFAPETDP